MGKTIRLLIIEDVEDHALLIVRELQKGGLDTSFERVETVEELKAALDSKTWDAIISDFNLPGFNGIDVLHLVQERGLDIPFLLVSGAIGEEKAAEVMKAGAHDYIRKGNYARLVPTLERELRDAHIRAERRQTADELTRHREHLEDLVLERTAELQAEKHEREQALLKLEAVLQHITDGVVISDLDGNVFTMNKEALALHQFEEVDQIRRHFSDFQEIFELLDFQGQPVPLKEWPLARAIQGERFVDFAVQVRRKDTGKLWIASYSGTPVCNQAGDNCLAVITVRDITEKKRAEQEIARLNRDLAARVAELEERNQELEAFNRMISHDLRQPLNTTAAACQAMQLFCDSGDRDCQDAIDMGYKGVLHMNTLIETLLTFSRSTHGDLRRESFNIGELARSVLAQITAAEPGRVVQANIPGEILANADPNFVRTILENLIGNAWKYTSNREVALIEFGVTGVDGEEVYYVKDNGSGFDMADAGRLFTPFERLPGAEGFEGSGIGLATVERIVRRHGGRIWAEGEPDKGSTFYFTLAARSEHATPQS